MTGDIKNAAPESIDPQRLAEVLDACCRQPALDQEGIAESLQKAFPFADSSTLTVTSDALLNLAGGIVALLDQSLRPNSLTKEANGDFVEAAKHGLVNYIQGAVGVYKPLVRDEDVLRKLEKQTQ